MSTKPIRIAGGILAIALAACAGDEGANDGVPRSVLLVSIDTLRADRLGCYGYELAETPHLDALAGRGVLFEQAFATTPLTFPSHTSLLTGTIPPYHGVRDNGTYQATADLVTLPEVLREAGWRTGAFVAAYVLDAQFGLDQGFEVYGDVPRRHVDVAMGVEEREASEVLREALRWLEGLGREEPFLCWVHFFEPHRPYAPPGGVPARMAERPYDAEVAAADRALGDLLAQLEALGRAEETLVVVTSDHGESLGEHGETTHSYFVYQGVLHVPLIVAHASLPAGRRVADWVSQVDVMPTVLELLGVEAPGAPPPGRSLAALARGEEGSSAPAYFESWTPMLNYGWAPLVGVARDGWKLIDVPRPELYELSSDPAEARDRHGELPERAGALRTELATLLERNRRPADYAEASRALSDDERAKLSQLGYAHFEPDPEPQEIGLDPKDGWPRAARRDRALGLWEQGRQSAALAELRALLAEDPDNAYFHSSVAAILIQLGRFEEASGHVQASLDGGFRTADNVHNLAICLLRTGRGEEAELAFRQALELDAQHLPTLLILAEVLAARGETAEAASLLRTFLGLWQGDEATGRGVRERLRTLGG